MQIIAISRNPDVCLKGDHAGALFTFQLTPEMQTTAAQLSPFWH